MSSAILQSLTEAQRCAVEHVDGPLLILAGPGSGKTRVVTHRIAYLLQSGISEHQILALTFTNKAVQEMQSRVSRLVPGSSVTISTFHRFCSRVLREHASYAGLGENFTIYDSADSMQVLREALGGLELALPYTSPEKIARAISTAKNELITAEDYVAPTASSIGRVLQEVYPAYQRLLVGSNAVDFDDLLLHVAHLLRHTPELRTLLDERYRYILVDEYQDTNLAQYAIVRALSIDFPNLAVTGDPDQSIYGWRGANIANILEFERDYPNVNVVRLEQNYRSTPNILRVADSLIVHNVKRKKKSLFTEIAEGEPVKLAVYPNQFKESEGIAADIASALNDGQRRASDFAILYRTNALSRSLEHVLRDYGIPYQIVNGVEFYQRREIKDVIAYLQLLNNPRNDVAFRRAISVPPRGIGKTSMQRLTDYAREHDLCLTEAAIDVDRVEKISARISRSIRKFSEMMYRLSGHIQAPLEEVIGLVLSETGYREWLQSSEDSDEVDRVANIEELLTAANEFDAQYPEGTQLETFLEQTALVNDIDAWEDEADKVTLMTLHAAKGLEFPCVYIVALEEGLIPHERSRGDLDQLEEERRLLFVGITRAEEQLQLSTAKVRAFRGMEKRTVPSSFMMELPRADMKLVGLDVRMTPSWLGHGEYSDVADEPGCSLEPGDSFEPGDSLESQEEQPFRPDIGPRADVFEDVAVTTAAQLQGSGSHDASTPVDTAEDDLSSLQIGMVVIHQNHGPGKVVALSGKADQRVATINFPAAGMQKVKLADDLLRLKA